MTHAWIIGQQGLLGRALQRAIIARPGWQLFLAPRLPWHDQIETRQIVRTLVRNLVHGSRTSDESSWSIVWAAGTGVVGTPSEALETEYQQFSALLDIFREEIDQAPSGQTGTFFFASSAGGVYAGSRNPPFTEETTPHALAPYGEYKLRAERLVERFSLDTGVASVIGRIANIYGPGQKLEKLQGLISHLARAHLSHQPSSVYVPLDTARDYLYVDDCASLIVDCLERVTHGSSSSSVTKILASGQGTTISSLLGHFRFLGKRAPHIVSGMSALGALQPVDLRLRSVVWPELDRRLLTPLPVGISATINDMLSRLQTP